MTQRSFSTSKDPKQAIITLHGFTGNVSSMEPVARALNIKNVNWFFLQGPFTISKGKYSWFGGNEQTGWKYKSSFDKLNKAILSLNKQGFPNEMIYILGFSQGACLAMEFIIRQKYSIGGVIPIAGFIGNKNRFRNGINCEKPNTPILLIHGDKDKVIIPEESVMAHGLFSEAGFRVELHTLSVGHKVPIKAKKIIEDFIYKNQG